MGLAGGFELFLSLWHFFFYRSHIFQDEVTSYGAVHLVACLSMVVPAAQLFCIFTSHDAVGPFQPPASCTPVLIGAAGLLFNLQILLLPSCSSGETMGVGVGRDSHINTGFTEWAVLQGSLVWMLTTLFAYFVEGSFAAIATIAAGGAAILVGTVGLCTDQLLESTNGFVDIFPLLFFTVVCLAVKSYVSEKRVKEDFLSERMSAMEWMLTKTINTAKTVPKKKSYRRSIPSALSTKPRSNSAASTMQHVRKLSINMRRTASVYEGMTPTPEYDDWLKSGNPFVAKMDDDMTLEDNVRKGKSGSLEEDIAKLYAEQNEALVKRASSASASAQSQLTDLDLDSIDNMTGVQQVDDDDDDDGESPLRRAATDGGGDVEPSLRRAATDMVTSPLRVVVAHTVLSPEYPQVPDKRSGIEAVVSPKSKSKAAALLGIDDGEVAAGAVAVAPAADVFCPARTSSAPSKSRPASLVIGKSDRHGIRKSDRHQEVCVTEETPHRIHFTPSYIESPHPPLTCGAMCMCLCFVCMCV
jgi:hypothetical protein